MLQNWYQHYFFNHKAENNIYIYNWIMYTVLLAVYNFACSNNFHLLYIVFW